MSKEKKTELWRIIRGLVQSEEKNALTLPRGLVLAFTPQPSDGRPGAGARLVWSRRNIHPGEVEDSIMRTAVLKALKSVDDRLLVAGPTFRTALKLREGWGSSMMTWRWVGTAVLLELQGKERDRAMEWLENR